MCTQELTFIYNLVSCQSPCKVLHICCLILIFYILVSKCLHFTGEKIGSEVKHFAQGHEGKIIIIIKSEIKCL